MAGPIVFISRWRIRQGKRAALEAMFAESLGFIGSAKPRTALFAAFEQISWDIQTGDLGLGPCQDRTLGGGHPPVVGDTVRPRAVVARGPGGVGSVLPRGQA